MPRGRVLVPAIMALLVLVADQASKAWAMIALPPGQERTIITGWLWFRLTRNTGATLGLLSDHNLLLIAISLLVAAAVAIFAARDLPGGGLGMVALGSIAGGAVSNVIDRIRLGGVIDFIELHGWPTDFNLADAGIRIGVVLFVVALLLEWRRGRRLSASAGSAP